MDHKRPESSNDSNEVTKKVRFQDAPDFDEEYNRELGPGDDNDLDLDTVRTRSKSRQVKTDVYSDEEEDEKKAKGGKEGELNWDSQEESEDEVEVVEGEEIETTTTQMQEDVESEDDQVPVEPFNLREDREEGRFDEEGFFTRIVDEDRNQDRWMSNLTKSDINKARQAHQRQQDRIAEAEKEWREREGSIKTAKQIYSELLVFLAPGESILEAIRRRGSSNTGNNNTGNRRVPMNRNRAKKEAKMAVESTKEISEEERTKKHELERITELCDQLMTMGNFNAYDETFDTLTLKTR